MKTETRLTSLNRSFMCNNNAELREASSVHDHPRVNSETEKQKAKNLHKRS